MDIIGAIHGYMHRTFSKVALLPPNGAFNPQMVQRPLIDAGNTGRYSLEQFMVKFDAPARGTLAPNGPNAASNIMSYDVTAQHAATYGGMGSIPSTPGSQGLVKGFRDGGL